MVTEYRSNPLTRLLVKLAGWLVYLFLALPVVVIVLSAFSPGNWPDFPPKSFSLRWFEALWQDQDWHNSLNISLILVVVVTPLTVLLGTSAAWALARMQFRLRGVLQAFILSPLMIPQIMLGVALLYQLTAWDLIGGLTGLAIGHIVVSLPYVVRTVSVSLAAMDRRLENASMSLGASPLYTFTHVTLPLIKPGVLAGALFAAVTSFGEISISLFLSAPDTVTTPVRIFNYVDQTFDPTVNAISVLFIGGAVVVLLLLEKTVGLNKMV